MPRRKEIFHAEHLRRQNAIDGGEAEFALAMNKVGDMRWLKSRLPGENGSREKSSIDSASDLQTQTLMELGYIHLWIFVS
jgi:hypothetical protein